MTAIPVCLTGPAARRVLAAALAVAFNAGILALLYFTPRPAPPAAPETVLRVTLIESPPPAPEIEPEPEPDPEPEAPPETAAPPRADPRPEPRLSAQAAPDAPVSARSAEAPEAAPRGEFDVYPVAPGTRSVLAGLQCPGDPEGFGRTGVCPETARRVAQLDMAGENAADHFAIDVSAIRLEFGYRPALTGALPLVFDNPRERRHLSSSDQMRDSLGD